MPFDVATDNFRARCIAHMVLQRRGLSYVEAARMFDAHPASLYVISPAAAPLGMLGAPAVAEVILAHRSMG